MGKILSKETGSTKEPNLTEIPEMFWLGEENFC
jgi:hypothetical protein